MSNHCQTALPLHIPDNKTIIKVWSWWHVNQSWNPWQAIPQLLFVDMAFSQIWNLKYVSTSDDEDNDSDDTQSSSEEDSEEKENSIVDDNIKLENPN